MVVTISLLMENIKNTYLLKQCQSLFVSYLIFMLSAEHLNTILCALVFLWTAIMTLTYVVQSHRIVHLSITPLMVNHQHLWNQPVLEKKNLLGLLIVLSLFLLMDNQIVVSHAVVQIITCEQ